jgi:enterochelin esterase family protein
MIHGPFVNIELLMRSTTLHLRSILFLVCFACQSIQAQDQYADFTKIIQSFYHAGSEKEFEDQWNSLVIHNKIPLVQEDSVAFLYRGEAKKVAWMGDFNGWGSNQTFKNEGERVPRTNLWILKASLPKDARLDYRILVNDNQWMVDPVNSSNQWSGVGGGSINSEVRMPDWKADSLTSHLLPEATPGKMVKDILFNSSHLGYQVTYSVYTPPDYQDQREYPVVYVTDGYEYMHERMGNLITVLDNLIYLGKIRPVVAVFLDHRDPINRSHNRRMQELPMNEKYLRFITAEFLPAVEQKFSISPMRSDRAIIGTSVGGLSAVWLAFTQPDLFGMAGIQSPAFWFKPEIYKICDQSQTLPLKVFMTTGLIHDTEEGARKLHEILEKRRCPNEFLIVNQGHSWGNWRDLTDDMLVYLFPGGN